MPKDWSMLSASDSTPPSDYPQRVKTLRGLRGLTQARLAELVGVSYASVNRWENGQSQPSTLSWRRILEIESTVDGDVARDGSHGIRGEQTTPPPLDFSADPNHVWSLAEAHRLAHGHLFNPAFASETSRIDPLPHQRLAVYEHMLHEFPLRLLLADDAGAGKTIMTGLYVREMLARRLIRRVLIAPPAGLVGNWQRELGDLFRLQFRIATGLDARTSNPFVGPESDLVITSIDTLAGERMFKHLSAKDTLPYDLVVFDEAHKLSANLRPDLSIRKTARYQLAEALAGVEVDRERWVIPWSALHVLLLTATPHMGKDLPYYFLWRLLLPNTLSTYDAFTKFPSEARKKHFIRRTKEEMLHFDKVPLYPQRKCATLSYELTQGSDSEQELYEETTDYIRSYYNRAKQLNRSAARLAMSVFQRRLASSTYALMRSFERRLDKLETLIENIRQGGLSEERLKLRQLQLDKTNDLFETQTSDEHFSPDGVIEQEEEFEDRVLEAAIGTSLAELEVECMKVDALLSKSRRLFQRAEESKFQRLQDVFQDPKYLHEKFIVFTEHRDTAHFLVRRLEGLGFGSQVALIHGGMPYQERERQVEFFRRAASEGGARFLVATDAAGEGINLQFCWLMVNYDIPWNPARLEQRMGRIHRYGQKHNPVLVINLVSASTREGRVLKTLLEKLEAIRKQLRSDKVFDVIGRLLEGVSLREYLEESLVDQSSEAPMARLESTVTASQVQAIQDGESNLFGLGGDVERELDRLNVDISREGYRRLLPGYVRRFVEKTAPLLDLRIDGDLDKTFRLVPTQARALDPLLPAIERYPEESRDRLTVHRLDELDASVWLHPGEPVFDGLSASVINRFGNEGVKGTVFLDPYATAPYLFHIAKVTVQKEDTRNGSAGGTAPSASLLESSLIGLRQAREGLVEECPIEHILMLRGATSFPPGSEPLAYRANSLTEEARDFTETTVIGNLVQKHQGRLAEHIEERVRLASLGFDYQGAELARKRALLNQRVREGDKKAGQELSRVRERQHSLSKARGSLLGSIRSEPDCIKPGEVKFLVHALVVPSSAPKEAEQYDAEVQSIAVRVATEFEERLNACVEDVSTPELARRAGLTDWPGFDILSRRPQSSGNGYQEIAIEVKGRRGEGNIQMSDNEWSNACNLRNKYWLYVVFDCATAHPRLLRIQDPFGKLLARPHESTAYSISPSQLLEASDALAQTGQ